MKGRRGPGGQGSWGAWRGPSRRDSLALRDSGDPGVRLGEQRSGERDWGGSLRPDGRDWFLG